MKRQYPWMDEGFNTYYDNRYQPIAKKITDRKKGNFFHEHVPENPEALAFQSLVAIKKDQPINTASEDFAELNYGLESYYKTGEWIKALENYLGTAVFDSCMKAYYHQWQFKHPYPEDFKAVVEKVSGKNTDALFSILDKKGSLPPVTKRTVKPTAFFNFTNTDKYSYINILPAVGYNNYDQFMVGLLVHNYNLPAERFQFLLAPLFATGSKTFNGLGRVSYTSYPASLKNQ